jgi:sugar phosphate isomerase/epimerase
MRIAAQLYTIRDFTHTRKDFQQSLHRLKDIGYEEVQLSAVGCMNGASPEVSAAECRAILDELGMKAPLTHRPWDEIRDRTDECIAFHREVGAELVAVGSVPGEYRAEGLDGYRRFVDDAEVVIHQLRQFDLTFGYHNHAFEFERLNEKGERPFDIMLERGSDGFTFEIDAYWVVHAGVDLLDLISNLTDRAPMVHLKDKAPVGNEVRMAPLGEGNLDWKRILKAFEAAGTILGAVEQDDCYGRDPMECLEASWKHLNSL